MAGFAKVALYVAAGIVTLAAGPAAAAGFIRYDVATLGQEVRTTTSPFDGTPRSSSTWISYIFSVVVPVDQAGVWTLDGSSYSSPLMHNFIAGSTNVIADVASISFSETSAPSLQYSSYSWGQISGTTCVAANGAFVTSGFAPNCGSVTWDNDTRLARTRFTGGVVDVRVSTGTGASVEGYGILAAQLVPLVPEPTTWALMVLGFGLTGYALRRRTGRAALA